jgi:hypothetical protein
MSEAGCCSEEGHVADTQSTVNGGGSADTASSLHGPAKGNLLSSFYSQDCRVQRGREPGC